ncbi:hypothetical protein PAEPH01_0067 [Pancytospora epiphaga]|nr:hypothetical protein PAEPH01_0067 [Pancytospora epiphaga]
MFYKKGRGIYSIIFAILTWLFMRRPLDNSPVCQPKLPREQFIYLSEANMDELLSGNWYVVVGEVTDESVITHCFKTSFNIAFLSVSSLSSARIAVLLGVRYYGEVIPLSEGEFCNKPGRVSVFSQNVDWVSIFDHYFFFYSFMMKRRSDFVSYVIEQFQAMLSVLFRLTIVTF